MNDDNAHTHDHAGPAHDVECHHLNHHHPRTDALCIDHLSYAYPSRPGEAAADARLTLRDVTLHVEQGVNLGVIGPNGAGKSTLIKIIVGLLGGYRGSVLIDDMPPRDACRKGDVIGYVPQRQEVEWKFPVSVRQVVEMGLASRRSFFHQLSSEQLDHIDLSMKRTGIAPLADRPIGELSGGQQQRVFIARALATQPKLLVLDEPMAAVDEVGQRQIAQLIRELHESLKLTVVIVSHDIQALAAGCNRVACLRQSIHYHDTPAGLTPQVIREVFQHEIEGVLKK